MAKEEERKGLALVTGASSGIGRALAQGLAARGWEVLGIARRAVPEAPGYRHASLDLATVDAVMEVEALLAEPLAEPLGALQGRPLALVNNAAVPGQRRPSAAFDGAELERTMTLNLTVPMLLMGLAARICPAASPLRVINVSTGLATQPLAGVMDYCASKAGLLMASRVFVEELGGRRESGVLVYEPGVVDTEMQVALRSSDRERFPQVEMFEAMQASGRLVEADAVLGPMIAFLESRSEGLATARFEP